MSLLSRNRGEGAMSQESITSEEEYYKALKRADELMDTALGTPESNELGILADLIVEYEEKHFKW